MLPVVYKYFPDEFLNIIMELHIYKIAFNNIRYVAEDIILKDEDTFLKDTNYRKQILESYENMINHIPKKYDRSQFVSSCLEIFPNSDKTGGHAITLIRGISDIDIKNGIHKDDYYILDDQNSISKLHDYYNDRKERLYKINIRDVDEVTIANINAILHAKCDIDPSCKFSKRVSRFCLDFSHNFLSQKEDILKPHLQYVKEKIIDPIVVPESNTDDCNSKTLLGVFLLGLVLGLIIGTIVYFLADKRNKKIREINGRNQ